MLAPPAFAVNGYQYVAALFSDAATYVFPPGVIAGLPGRRARPGDIVTLYGIGFGPVIPNAPAGEIVQQATALSAPLRVFFGQVESSLTYGGLAPNSVGLYQFNVVVPNVSASDTVPLTFTLNGVRFHTRVAAANRFGGETHLNNVCKLGGLSPVDIE